jgi:hypothetical protein
MVGQPIWQPSALGSPYLHRRSILDRQLQESPASEAGPTLTRSDIETEGRIPGITAAQFAECAEKAKQQCLVFRALAAVPVITLKASPT